ncbi:MAG: hypothetical protein KJ593_04790 [Candidatus Omnitrophica bacterium]|nr:hypothetical protein [Candidatus Omnitrophota bacterium]
MSIIFDALKKAQSRFSSQHAKEPESKESQKPQEAPKDKTPTRGITSSGFAAGEDLTQPIKPIAGTRPIAEQEKDVAKEKATKRPRLHMWTIHDIRHMNPFAFIAMIVFGLLGSLLVFYLFAFKFQDKYLVQVTEEGPVTTPEASGAQPVQKKSKKNLFHLSPEISLSLDGIVSSEGRNLALIDDQIVEVGDTIKGAKVISVGSREVVLSFGGKEFVLTIE